MTKSATSGAEARLTRVVAALEKAAERGDLSPSQVAWSVGRLSGRGRRGNPRLEGVERRQDILRAAIAIFATRGYRHTTVEEIANGLLLTKAGIYHYFSSKLEILEAIVEQAMVDAERAVAEGIAAGSTPTERLRFALERYAAVILHQEAQSVFLNHFDELSKPVQEGLNARRKKIESALRKALEEGIAMRELQAEDSRIAVFGMLGAINWAYSWYDQNGRLAPEELVTELVDRVTSGIIARPE